MKKGTRILAAVLAVCMMACMMIVQPLPKVGAAGESFQKILHLDCGRKYFTKDWIISLINEMAHDGYTHLQLAFGNDGLRFLLDDMTVNANGRTYSSQNVKAAVQQGNRTYYDFGVNELTQSEMDQIIAHAQKKNIQIIPLLNTPGHMNAIVTAMGELGISSANAPGSKNTMNLFGNQTAVDFVKALVQNYIDYFAAKGCKQFNFGADEYANDADGAFSFNRLSESDWTKFVAYVNDLAKAIKAKNMTPMAFNDGFYFNGRGGDQFDTSIVIEYWSNGWGSYPLAAPTVLEGKGHPLINFHGDFYYVLGKNDTFDSDFASAGNFQNKQFASGSGHIENPVGSAFAIWCDYPGAETEQVVAQKTRLPMRAMALAMNNQQGAVSGMDQSVAPGGFNADGSLNKEISSETSSETPSTPDSLPPADVTVDVGGSQIRQQNGLNKKLTAADIQIKHPALVDVTVKAKEIPGIPAKTEYPIEVVTPGTEIANGKYLIKSGNQFLKNENSAPGSMAETPVDQKMPENAFWTIEKNPDGTYLIYQKVGNDIVYLGAKQKTISDGWRPNRFEYSLQISKNQSFASWTYQNGHFYQHVKTKDGSSIIGTSNKYADLYLKPSGNTWTFSEGASSLNLCTMKTVSIPGTDTTYDHTITFTGKQPGRTEVTVGDVLYTVQVNGEIPSEEIREITLRVGQSTTNLIEGYHYAGTAVENAYVNTSLENLSSKETHYEKITGGITDGIYLLENIRAQKLLSNAEHIESGNWSSEDQYGRKLEGNVERFTAQNLWTVKADGAGFTVQDQTGSYLQILSGNAVMTAEKQVVSISQNGNTWTIEQNSSYLNDFGNRAIWAAGWKDNTAREDSGSQWNLYRQVPAQSNSTQVTFTGTQVGTTTVKIGHVTYRIQVLDFDIHTVPPLEIEHWITNSQVTPNGVTVNVDDGANVSEIRAADYPALCTEAGLSFRDITPEFGQDKEKRPVQRWFVCYLSYDKRQTSGEGMDSTKKGPGFIRFRYWNGQWEGMHYQTKEWMPINTDRTQYRLTEYYLQETHVTQEVKTLVMDWGETYSTWKTAPSGHWFWEKYVENGSKFCYMDFAVVYEDGTYNPASFPNDNTIFFHADPAPRKIGDIYIQNSSEYEVYKVTLTDGKSTGYENASTFNPNYDETTERQVWPAVGQEPTGDAYLPGVTLNNQEGVMVTIYIRNKKPDTNLSVHYIDDKTKVEFYSYNIQGANGALFDPNIRLIGKNTLENNVIRNTQGVNITVNAKLESMPQIGEIYTGNNYNCERVVRSEDGRDVYLYYTFEPMRNYVLDFGLPLRMSFADLGILPNGLESVVCKKQPNNGTIRVDMAKQEVIYTPNQVMNAIDSFFVEWKGKESGGKDVYPNIQILVYPATTVYYEEGYLTDSTFLGGSKGDGMQQPDEIGAAPAFGFDPYYSGQTGMSNGTEAVSHEAGSVANFRFKGTGFDLYLNCAPNTGLVSVMVKNMDTDSIIRYMYVDTKMESGKTNATSGQNIEAFSLPVVSMKSLTYGTYQVTLWHLGRDVGVVGGDIRVDGFRVYNPLNNWAHEAYAPDEMNPTFVEMRNAVLTGLNVNDSTESAYNKAGSFLDQIFEQTGSLTGAVLVEKNNAYTAPGGMQDLLDNGPKNELFLYSGQALTFNLGTAKAQIGLKAVNGNVDYQVNGALNHVTSSTDMFYHKGLTGEVTITNQSGGILSVTLLKVFNLPAGRQFKLEPVTQEQMAYAIRSVGYVNTAIRKSALHVNLKDYTGAALVQVTLTAEGDMRETHTFTAEEIRAAVMKQIPEGYVLADEKALQDVTLTYGENGETDLLIGKKATLNISFVTRKKTFRWLFWMDKEHVTEVGKARIVRVQTGDDAWCVLNAADVEAVLPEGYSLEWDMWDTYVTYGFEADTQITVTK